MTSKATAQDVMDVLNERGWCQGALEAVDGRVCLMGAMNVASFGNSQAVASHASLHGKVIHYLHEKHNQTVPGYNDHPDTTLEDIMMVLKEVANDDE